MLLTLENCWSRGGPALIVLTFVWYRASIVEILALYCMRFLLTVGSFLLTVELLYLQLTILVFLLTARVFLSDSFSFLTYSWSFLLAVGESASNKGL